MSPTLDKNLRPVEQKKNSGTKNTLLSTNVIGVKINLDSDLELWDHKFYVQVQVLEMIVC